MNLRNLVALLVLSSLGVVLAGCPDEKKDAASPGASGAAAASASASATPKAAGTDSKGSGW